jgi:hypothetical protein
VLLQLVPAEHDEPPRLVLFEYGVDELLTEGAGPAGDQDVLARQIEIAQDGIRLGTRCNPLG